MKVFECDDGMLVDLDKFVDSEMNNVSPRDPEAVHPELLVTDINREFTSLKAELAAAKAENVLLSAHAVADMRREDGLISRAEAAELENEGLKNGSRDLMAANARLVEKLGDANRDIDYWMAVTGVGRVKTLESQLALMRGALIAANLLVRVLDDTENLLADYEWLGYAANECRVAIAATKEPTNDEG